MTEWTTTIILWIVIATITAIFWKDIDEYFMLLSVSKMGHMKYWWIFGFEWWGTMKPESMLRRIGENEYIEYRTLFLGLWVRGKKTTEDEWRKK